jgi:hypothetical protein
LYTPEQSIIRPEPPKLVDYDHWLPERAKMIIRVLSSTREQAIQRKKCEADIMHWLRYFCFIYEPRNIKNRDLAYFPYGYQETEIRWLVEILFKCGTAYGDKENVLYEKSRDMGISWMILMVFLWFFLFHDASFIIGSRKEEEVYKRGSLTTLFGKLIYQLDKHLQAFPWLLPPDWTPKREITELIIRKPPGHGNGEILGESSNPNFARGKRGLAILYDEFAKWLYDAASWQSGSDSAQVQIAVSTPGDTRFDMFGRLRHQEEGEVIVRTMHWKLHPEKAKDLEIINNKETSSWYRDFLKKKGPAITAKEVDISYAYSIKGIVFDKYGSGNQCKGLKAISARPIIRVWDPGLHFYVLFMQVDAYQRLLYLREVYHEAARLETIAEEVLAVSAQEFPGYEFEDCGDPYGTFRQNSAQPEPEYSLLRSQFEINVQTAFMQSMSPKIKRKSRISLLDYKLGQMVGSTDPPSAALLVDVEKCGILHRAFAGEYRRVINQQGIVQEDIDEQHPAEDAIDCAGMGALFKIRWASATSLQERIKVRKNQVDFRRPSRARGFQ